MSPPHQGVDAMLKQDAKDRRITVLEHTHGVKHTLFRSLQSRRDASCNHPIDAHCLDPTDCGMPKLS